MTAIMGNKEIDLMTARVLSVAAIALDLLPLSGPYSRLRFDAGGAKRTAVLLASDERYLVLTEVRTRSVAAAKPILPRNRAARTVRSADRDSTPTIVTSQIPVDTWHEVIGHPTLADAILVHNVHRLQLTGDSMRKRNAKTIPVDDPADR
jgi:hypothetical protein